MDEGRENIASERRGPERIREALGRVGGDVKKGLDRYMEAKPIEKWEVADYARAIFMIGPGATSEEQVKMLKDSLMEAAREKGKEKGKGGENKIHEELANLERKHKKGDSSWGDLLGIENWGSASTDEKGADMLRREILMNYELWVEMETTGTAKNLSIEKLLELSNYWQNFANTKTAAELESKKIIETLGGISKIIADKASMIQVSQDAGSGEQGISQAAGGSGGTVGERGTPEAGGGGGGSVLERIAKNTYETARNTEQMVQQLGGIKDVLGKMRENWGNEDDKGGYEARNKEYQKTLKEMDDNLRKIAEAKAKEEDEKNKIREQQIEEQYGGKYGRVLNEAGEKGLVKIDPWEKENAELFEGSIDEVLTAHMKRIVYLTAKRFGKNGVTIDDAGKSAIKALDPNTNESEFIGNMDKVYEGMKKKGSIHNEKSKHMRELKRWAKTIIKNSQYGGGRLKITEDAYKDFDEIAKMDTLINKYGNGNSTDRSTIEEFDRALNDAVTKLNKRKFTDYFIGKNKDTGGILKFDYREGKGKAREGGVPKSIWETCALIERAYSNEGYGTGEEHELLNENGELNVNNLFYFMKARAWEQSDRHSQSPIDTLQQATLRTTYVDLPIGVLMDVPQYTMSRDFEMSGDLTKEGALENRTINSGWGDYKELSEFSYQRREIYKRWIWLFDTRHNDGVLFIDNKVRLNRNDFVNTQYDIVKKGDWYRNGYTFLFHQMPSAKGTEMEDYFTEDKAGSLGMAGATANIFYNHMTDFTEYYMKKDDNGNPLEVKGFDENMAYKALGVDGSIAFLSNVGEQSLMQSKEREKFKGKYKEFVKVLMRERRDHYVNKYPDKKKLIDDLVDKQLSVLDEVENSKMIIGFDSAKFTKKNTETYEILFELQKDLATMVEGKGLVNENAYDNWQGSNENVVTRTLLRKEVKKFMRSNINKYFDDIKNVEIVPGKDGERPKTLGEMEVKLDRNGRVITEAEWEKLGELGDGARKTTSISQILDQYTEFGDVDEVEFARANEEMEKNGVSVEERKRRNKKYYDSLERSEQMAMAFLNKAAGLERVDLNWMKQTQPPDRVKKIIRNSLKSGLAKIYGLVGVEEDFLDDGSYYSLEPLLIAAKNNTSYNVKVNQGAWWYHTSDVWNVNKTLRPKSGLLGQITAMAPGTAWEFMPVVNPGDPLMRGKTIIEVMQGGEGADMQERWKRNIDGNRYEKDTSREAMQNIFNRVFVGGDKLVTLLLGEKVLTFHDVMSPDPYFPGRLKFDPAKAQEANDTWYIPIRDVFDKSDANYNRKIVKDGREMTVAEAMFGDKILKAKETMKLNYRTKALWLGDADAAKQYKKLEEAIDQAPGIAVLAFMAGNTITEHSYIMGSIYEKWDYQEINEFITYLEEYIRAPGERIMKDGQIDYTKTVSRLPFNIINEIMRRTLKNSLEDVAFWDIFRDLLLGIAMGIIVEMPGELGEAYLKSVQPIRAVS